MVVLTDSVFCGVEASVNIEQDLRGHLSHHPHFADEVSEVTRGGVVCPRPQLAGSRTGTRIGASSSVLVSLVP